jgi:predicted O-methyltransferase YrrM
MRIRTLQFQAPADLLHRRRPHQKSTLMLSPEKRLALKQSMPRTMLSLHHTENCRLLPNRTELLHRLPHGGVAAEIGVAFGDYTREIVAHNKPRQLHLIDAWDLSRYNEGYETVRSAFAGEIAAERVHLHVGGSTDMLPTFADATFDWVYIDTDHSYANTWNELVLCNAKVKRDGRICGHDFCTGNVLKPVVYGVVQAVNKFCVEFDWQFEFMTVEPDAHFSYCLKRL